MTAVWVVGAGLTGATIARHLTDAGHSVTVFEARDYAAGNCYDEMYDGMLVNAYGPHYFRTNSPTILAFAQRFAHWRSWTAKVLTSVDDKLYRWPIAIDTIEDICGPDWQQQLYTGPITNFETACLAKVPDVIYRMFIKGYTEKQWGASCQDLSARLAARFEPRQGDDHRFTQQRFQMLPEQGYTRWIDRMLDRIPIHFKVRLTHDDLPDNHVVFYTGPIDHCFDYKFGRLRYRRQQRTMMRYPKPYVLSVPQVNDPSSQNSTIRQIDWSWMARTAQRTFITSEVPEEATDPDNLEYPFPDQANDALYEKYKLDAAITAANVIFCGRLGSNRYLDMDQAIGHGLSIAKRWLNDFRR